MKKLLCRVGVITLFCLGLPFIVYAGITGKISGKVIDDATGDALPGANVVIQGTTMGAATDMDGDYFIINVPPGSYTLVASMIGYKTTRLTNVLVSVDRTITTNFSIQTTVLEGEEVTIVSEREVVPMDVSASQIVADAEEIEAVPVVTDLQEYINLQAGIDNGMIRGGGLDQTQFMVDGMQVVDNRKNRPMMMVNLSSVQELSVIKGGFNAEYGNVRSGLINVVTKEGSPTTYHGSMDARISPARLKHSGSSLLSPDNYYLRAYLDPEVMWDGTGVWDAYTQQQNKTFAGWNTFSENLLTDDDPDNDMTPEEARDLFIWQHASEGSGALGHTQANYGDKPDWQVDASLGGPVPGIGRSLGNLSFFASYRKNREMFALPTARDYLDEENANFKLTSHLSTNMKLTLEGLYGEIHSMQNGVDDLFLGAEDIFVQADQGEGGLFWPDKHSPFDVRRSMQGLSFDHVLSARTFYKLRVSHTYVKYDASGPARDRDTTILRSFGDVGVTEEPYGFYAETGTATMIDGQEYEGWYGYIVNQSKIHTINAKLDLVSQIDKYNQIKVGVAVNLDDFDTSMESWGDATDRWTSDYSFSPSRIGAYIQDKLEFEGMIANFGLRLDNNRPNTDWYTVERYSQYFMKAFKDQFLENAPTAPAEGHLKVSPRLGISHPISGNAKLYFNYGHFYSMPITDNMYHIDFGSPGRRGGIEFIGNPSADMPKTVAYELGWEYNLWDMFLLSVAGYYKDVSGQTGDVSYENYDGRVNYSTTENNNYADIRGFELRIDKRWGEWLTGWLNYNYMVTTEGFVGREQYFEDQRQQRIFGLQNPYQERPIAQPYFRANLVVRSPLTFGPDMAGKKPLGDVQLGLFFNWKAGRYETWDPLETFQLEQNLQWQAFYNFDFRLSKRIQFGRKSLNLFMDVQNVFNTKLLSSLGFIDGDDRIAYLESLHLPLYAGAEYKEAGYTAGDDTPGDLRSSDKPYINDPNRDLFMHLGLRAFYFGLKFNF